MPPGKSWIFTSNDPSEMHLVSTLLNENGIDATIGPFSDEPELAGEVAVLVPDERCDEAEKIVSVFYEQRDQLRAEERAQQTWARYGWILWVALAGSTLSLVQFGPELVVIWLASVGWFAWLIRRDQLGGKEKSPLP